MIKIRHDKQFKKGQIPWNKGQASDTDSVLKMTKKIKEQYANGRKPWNKGLKTGLVPKSAFKKGHKAPKTAFKKGLKSWNKGTKGVMTAWNKGLKGYKAGKLNNRWKGGITKENNKIRHSFEYKIWRELVYERDDWTCQKCNKRGNELNPHHILNFSDNEDIRFNIDNGITLCRECHYDFHKEYGFNNNNIEQLDEFLAYSVQA